MILIVRQTVYDKVCKHCSFKMKNRIHLSLVDLFNVKKNLVLSGIFFKKSIFVSIFIEINVTVIFVYKFNPFLLLHKHTRFIERKKNEVQKRAASYSFFWSGNNLLNNQNDYLLESIVAIIYFFFLHLRLKYKYEFQFLLPF